MQQHFSRQNFSCVNPQELRRPKYVAPYPSSEYKGNPECIALFCKMFQGYFYLSELYYLSNKTKQFFRLQVSLILSYCIFRGKTSANSIHIPIKKKKIFEKPILALQVFFTASLSKFCPIYNNFSKQYSLRYFNTLTVVSLVFLPTHRLLHYFFSPLPAKTPKKLFE